MAGALSMPGLELPDWTKNPASADLGAMAGAMAGPTSYSPEESSLVSGQLGKLLSKDSDYMTRARTRAAQVSAGRGLLNSSLAASAGESAAIDAALPIAQQDAQSFLTAQRDNTLAKNTFDSDANAFARQGALAKFQGATNLYSQGLDLAQSDKQLQADTAYRQADLAFRRDSSGREMDIRQGALSADDSFRREQLAAQTGSQQADRELEARRLDAQVADQQANRQMESQRLQQQARSSLAGDIAQLRQQATQAQAQLEADPNMSREAKAAAITAISRKVSADVEELARFSGVNLPSAWPDWVNQVGTPAAPPAAAPAAPQQQITPVVRGAGGVDLSAYYNNAYNNA